MWQTSGYLVRRGSLITFRAAALVCCIGLLCAATLPQSSAREQTAETDESSSSPTPQASPEELGFDFPDDPPTPSDGRRVLVPPSASGSDEPVVGKVVVEAGGQLAVMLDDGRLIMTPSREATLTDRPFAPITKDALAERLVGGKFRAFKTRQTRRYLYVYNTSDAFYQATSRILETMYPNLFNFCRRQKIDVHDPEVPMVVVMFRTQEEFNAYRAMSRGVVAYYNVISNQVLMYEQSELNRHAPEIAIKQSISTIAHEGVHQVLFNIGVQKRLSRWPMWIGEGLPEYFAPTSVDRGVRWKGIGVVNDLRMLELVTMLKQSSGTRGDGQIVRHTVSADRFSSGDYACAWGLTHFLAERRREWFYDYLRDVSRLDLTDAPSGEESLALFTKHFGEDLAGIEKAMFEHLEALDYVDPLRNTTHYVVMLETRLENAVERRALVTISPTMAKEWQTANRNAQSQSAIRSFANRQSAERFAAGWLQSR